MTTAISKQDMKPATKILSFMRRTGNKHTALEIAEILNLDVNLVRRRITDMKRQLRVVDTIKEGYRRVRVYQA